MSLLTLEPELAANITGEFASAQSIFREQDSADSVLDQESNAFCDGCEGWGCDDHCYP